MKSNNQINVPAAKEAMNQFKMQAASEVGVNLSNGYNGDLTSRQAGSVGGQMVKKMVGGLRAGPSLSILYGLAQQGQPFSLCKEYRKPFHFIYDFYISNFLIFP